MGSGPLKCGKFCIIKISAFQFFYTSFPYIRMKVALVAPFGFFQHFVTKKDLGCNLVLSLFVRKCNAVSFVLKKL
jgi:hypothetical protein